MSRDERLAVVISDALRASIEAEGRDPGAVDRVGHAVGVALGGPAAEPDDRAEPTATQGPRDEVAVATAVQGMIPR